MWVRYNKIIFHQSHKNISRCFLHVNLHESSRQSHQMIQLLEVIFIPWIIWMTWITSFSQCNHKFGSHTALLPCWHRCVRIHHWWLLGCSLVIHEIHYIHGINTSRTWALKIIWIIVFSRRGAECAEIYFSFICLNCAEARLTTRERRASASSHL